MANMMNSISRHLMTAAVAIVACVCVEHGVHGRRRSQHLLLARASVDRSAPEGVRNALRHQEQCRFRQGWPDRAAGGGGAQQSRRCALDQRVRASFAGQGRGRDARRRVAGAGGCYSRAIARCRRTLVRPDDARAGRVRLQGARGANEHHLRGTGRSKVEGPHLRALGPIHLQYCLDRLIDRPQGRRLGPRLGCAA